MSVFCLFYNIIEIFDAKLTKKNSSRITEQLHIRGCELRDRFRTLSLREIEFAALVGVALCNESKLLIEWEHNFCCIHFVSFVLVDALFKDNTMSAFRERLFVDFHEELLTTYTPPAEAGARFGQLLCLINDLQTFTYAIEETTTVFKVFHPYVSTLFDDD